MKVDYLLGLKTSIQDAFEAVYQHHLAIDQITLVETKKEFVGSYTLVVFPYTKVCRQAPEAIATHIGAWIEEHSSDVISGYNVVKGFLNFEFSNAFWLGVFERLRGDKHLGIEKIEGSKIMVEFSSPNTNKPLHLGHIRNNLLGWSTSCILKALGHEVVKTQIINDRGIAICKSMLAWQLYGEGQTPASSGIKGDHLVGEYYRKFDIALSEEYAEWQKGEEGQRTLSQRENKELSSEAFFKGYKNQYFNIYSSLGGQAREMLLAWERGDERVRDLWKQMNTWVYEGFDKTYRDLGVSFDYLYYESDTYLLGKDIVQHGLEAGHFYRQEDGSVWVDLEDRGLDKKILLRSDGTSVYMTQDLGTAQMRYQQLGTNKMIYVVGDEQDYHFQVLFEILKKLKAPYADGLYHLSYGMVDLPTGRMKSREGTVVDADDLIAEVVNEVRQSAMERGELEDLDEATKERICQQIGLAALKFFLLKVNPKKRMIFDPKESVDMQGQTGPYIQNAFVRISSIRRKLAEGIDEDYSSYGSLEEAEIDLIQSLMTYGEIVRRAGAEMEPSLIAGYGYDLAKKFHRFYHDVRIISAESEGARAFRLLLSDRVAAVLQHSMSLLGIEMPERM